ncbi:hypothetical protein WT25_16860 [Burkholderia territorii]|nr:hypothetical protein WT25_16860 [Burkholderia territorii]
MHCHYAVLYLCWIAAVGCAIWQTAVCRLAVQAPGSSWPLLVEVARWAATLCQIVPDMLRHWRRAVAMRLYFEDIADGVCPDRGMQITQRNGMRWCPVGFAVMARREAPPPQGACCQRAPTAGRVPRA